MSFFYFLGVVTLNSVVLVLASLTRMHSSKMRTARSLTVSRGGRGGVEGGGVNLGCLPRDV